MVNSILPETPGQILLYEPKNFSAKGGAMENRATSNEDKRGTPRVKKLFMIAYLPKDDGPSRTPVSLGRTVDISPSGVGMEIYKEIAVGTVMEMEIDLEAVPLSALGKVVRVDPLENGNFHIGISFDDQQELLQTRIALSEISALRQQVELLERVMTKLARTGWPWDEHGRPNEILRCCKDGFAPAMLEAKKLLGRTHQSIADLKEPKS